MQLEWSKDAVEDLDTIWEYIAEDNMDRAFSFIEELRAEARKLPDNPMMGKKIPELNDETYREWFYKEYTLVYQVTEKSVIIHEVYNQKKYFIRSINRYDDKSI
ncbi:type II toxin-antitoxin system RelE/ParE family toxin [Anaerocolumna chitinilytica]|uniref:Type II toxin-antitoxin system RelE/ParE family toxin n=1 Tax=Anaerocolumna chitinilytica TaxID=1727145 RepID=A0A7I8DIZ9_9FIRM|nr:type II toxin-antitoxin system RelE/ParE family toxin [Anaerocolumna chitinilytica]BCJ98409.1 hypothetical protein bsdcttw_14500 [Anaerocolumna chitinilytica]